MAVLKKRALAGLVAVSLLATFAAVYGWHMWSFIYLPGPHEPNNVTTYVATTLSGLIGGVVAMEFNDKLPIDTSGGSNYEGASGTEAAKLAAGRLINADSTDLLGLLTAAYAVVYLLFGMAAVGVCMYGGDKTPELIENFALIAFGLAAAVARTLVRVPPVPTKPIIVAPIAPPPGVSDTP